MAPAVLALGMKLPALGGDDEGLAAGGCEFAVNPGPATTTDVVNITEVDRGTGA
jgi:hypothetical protein